MKILALERDLKEIPDDLRADILKREALAVWKLQQAGSIRDIHLDGTMTRAVIILECESLDTARDALATLPLVAEGYIEFELTELRPYPGYGRLFGG
jgi:hypothetical protein